MVNRPMPIKSRFKNIRVKSVFLKGKDKLFKNSERIRGGFLEKGVNSWVKKTVSKVPIKITTINILKMKGMPNGAIKKPMAAPVKIPSIAIKPCQPIVEKCCAAGT